MGLIIDTSVFVRIERAGGYPDFTPWRSLEPFFIAAITVSEMSVGLLRAESERRRQQRQAFFNALLDRVDVLSFDQTTAIAHAQMTVDLWRRGKPIGSHDALIAASAITHGCSLLTSNVSEFRHVTGLSVIEYAPVVT